VDRRRPVNNFLKQIARFLDRRRAGQSIISGIAKLAVEGEVMRPVVSVAVLLTLFWPAAGCQFHISLFPPKKPLKPAAVSGKGRDKVLIIPVHGFISSYARKGLAGEATHSSVGDITDQIEAARGHDGIKAVILTIDSPGGVVTACDVIHRELVRYKREKGVKIVALQMSVATSGAYYISTVADRIIAHPTTVTGSIGVIMVKVNAGGLLEKIGVKDDTVRSGAHKGFATPMRGMTPEERKVMQTIIGGMHDRFKTITLESRGRVEDQETTFDGRVFIAREAKRRNLIDQVGYLPDAIDAARKLAGLEEAAVIRFTRGKTSGPVNPYSVEPYEPAQDMNPAPPRINLLSLDLRGLLGGASPAFLYMWSP